MAPTLPTSCGSLPPAAAPAARQSRLCGPGWLEAGMPSLAMRALAQSSCSVLSVTPTTEALNSPAAISASAPQPQPISSTRPPGLTPAISRARRTFACWPWAIVVSGEAKMADE